MTPFLEQIFKLLTSDTGSLMYHLVLAFSIAGALQSAIAHLRSGAVNHAGRMAAGLFLLLLLQMSLFVAAGLALQGLVNAPQLLPPLDRAITLVSLLVIIWLWAFPEPARAADGAALLIGLLLITLITLGMVYWLNQPSPQSFNGSLPDIAAAAAGIVLATAGLLLLALRRPDGFGFGLAMLLLILAGHAGHLIFIPLGSDYPGAIRLAQMAAYPLLLLLPQRLMVPEVVQVLTQPKLLPAQVGDKQGIPLDPELAPLLITLVNSPDLTQACQVAAEIITRGMPADYGLVLQLSDQGDAVCVCGGYNRVAKVAIPPTSLEGVQVPGLRAVVRQRRAMRFSDNNASPDSAGIARLLSLERSGPMMVVPAADSGSPGYSVLVLDPHSKQFWGSNDQDKLKRLVTPLAQFLHQYEQRDQEFHELRTELDTARKEQATGQDERSKLREQIAELSQKAEKDSVQIQSLVAMVANQDGVQEKVARLQSENDSLRRDVAALNATAAAAAKARSNQGQGEDLRLALQEIALLKNSLAEADRKLVTLQKAGGDANAAPPPENLAAIAEELRQPLASISGYTDFLLGESMGILGLSQRKFLERIKVAIQRMERLVDELIQTTQPARQNGPLELAPIDLSEAIDAAIASTSQPLRDKHITLRVDLPDRLPQLRADREALHTILVSLLQNAGSVTPPDGDALLRAHVHKDEGGQNYVLVQVADTGGGISPEVLPRVFAPRRPGLEAALGEAPPVDLAEVKTLVEMLGGRIWVDNDPGQGAIYSVVLPVAGPSGAGARG